MSRRRSPKPYWITSLTFDMPVEEVDVVYTVIGLLDNRLPSLSRGSTRLSLRGTVKRLSLSQHVYSTLPCAFFRKTIAYKSRCLVRVCVAVPYSRSHTHRFIITPSEATTN